MVASEVFELLGETGRRLKAVAMSAAKKWAGPEQAASGLLVTYLEKNVPSAKPFLVSQQSRAKVLQSHSMLKRSSFIPFGSRPRQGNGR